MTDRTLRKEAMETPATIPLDLQVLNGTPFNPLPKLDLLRKVSLGEPLTQIEETAWANYEAELELAVKHRGTLGLLDLAEVMRNGVTEPEMLVDGLIVRGEYHSVYGEKESGKTWLLLLAAGVVMARGEKVVWVDKEMGAKNIANRL